MLAILPLSAFFFLWLAFRSAGQGWRAALLCAATVWGVAATVLVEALSAVRLLTAAGLAVGWLLATAAAACWWLVHRAPPPELKPAGGQAETRDQVLACLLGAVGLILALVALTALLAPPNTWDVMEYHLPRVVHWIQNRSVAFYPTHELKQLHMAPWSEYAILQVHLLSGSDRLDNLVQWFAMAASMAGVSLIAELLRAGLRGQVLAAVLCATLPQGILTASGAKNDYAAGFWLVAAVYHLLRLKHTPNTGAALLSGAAAGLACLTKGSMYVLVPTVAAVVLAVPVRKWKPELLRRLPLLLVVALLPSFPHYLRNYRLYGFPLGPSAEGPPKAFKYTNDEFTPGTLWSNLLRNAALHLGTPDARVNAILEAGVTRAVSAFGGDVNDPKTTWDFTRFQVSEMSRHEALAGNPLHALVFSGALLLLIFRWRKAELGEALALGLGVALAFVAFCFAFKWQPWHTRLHLPLFLLGSAVAGTAVARLLPARAGDWLALALLVAAGPPLLENQTRPLAYAGESNVWNQPRNAMYFADNRALKPSYEAAVAFVKTQSCRDVGLDLATGRYSYPLFALLEAEKGQRTVREWNIGNASKALAAHAGGPSPCLVLCPNCKAHQQRVEHYSRLGMTTHAFEDLLVFGSGLGDCSAEFSSGWYYLEQGGGDWWRWSAGQGQIRIQTKTPLTVILRGEISSLTQPNHIDLLLNGEQRGRFQVNQKSFQRFESAPLALHSGENSIQLVSAKEAVKLPSDARPLAIGIRNAAIAVVGERSCTLTP